MLSTQKYLQRSRNSFAILAYSQREMFVQTSYKSVIFQIEFTLLLLLEDILTKETSHAVSMTPVSSSSKVEQIAIGAVCIKRNKIVSETTCCMIVAYLLPF